MRTFFIVGCPRSGTTMLQQALNRHAQVIIPPETAFFSMLGYTKTIQGEHLQRISEDLEIALPQPARRLYRARETRAFYAEMARLYIERSGKRTVTHFGDKTNEHLSRLHRIRRVLPGSKIILLYRDGRDVALSLPRLPWTSPDVYVNFGLWLYCYRLQKRAQRGCGLPLLCVRYEDLATDPEKEMRRVLAFLDLPYDTAVLEADGSSSGIPAWEYPWKARAIQEIGCARVGLWRHELSREQVGILERWGGQALRELGYELVTEGDAALPWFFRLRVSCKSLLWLARRPRYAQAKARWVARNGAACKRREVLSCEA